MKFITVLFLFILHALCIAASAPAELPSQFKLLPQPQKIEMLPGNGIMYNELRSVYLENTNTRPVMTGLLAGLPLSGSAATGTLTLKIVNDLGLPSAEGYILELSNNQIVIQATSQAGLFYGIQTLQQLVEDSYDQQIKIPALKITDYPEIAYRAIHLDLKHHLDAGNYYYQMIDKLAGVKINAIIVEFEDKLRYRKEAVVGAKDAISIEEFVSISRYANERNIEISPLIQGLGHASFILKHEEYKDLRDDVNSDWVFDALNPKTYEVQFSLYEDAMAATPYGKYLHVGGDEVGDLGKSELSKKSGKSAFDLQMYWLKKVSEFAEKHGRKAIFWDDMVFKLSGLYKTTWNAEMNEKEVKDLWEKNRHILDESINLFPKNCVYMRWNYDSPGIPGNILALDWYKSHGLDVMAATSAQQIWAMMPRANSNFQAIKEYSRITSEKKLVGILCTIWDDASPHFETVWRGIYDFGLMSWNYEDISADQAHTIFRHRYFAPAASTASFDFQNILEQALPFWETALIREGDRDNYHTDFKLIDLPASNKSGEWSKKNSAKLDSAKKALTKYAAINDRLSKTNSVARRNAYTLRVFNQINALSTYSAKLLLLLEKYDKASAGNKKKVGQEIGTFVNSFEDLRKEFERVFSETRIPGNPEGYQLDSNFHHHLANGTNNTDWMFMYELPMNNKIREWLSSQQSIEAK